MEADGLFIGMGFQKCATTQITMRLSEHPSVWPHPIRELRYWNTYYQRRKLPKQTRYAKELTERILALDESKPRWTRHVEGLSAWTKYALCKHSGAEDYLDLFSDRDKNARAFGEISPDYASLSPSQVREIYESLGHPKLFVIMREPVARAVSAINHENRLRPGSVDSARDQIRFLKSKHTRSLSEYGGMIRALQSLPDQRNVRFFFFEDYLDDMKSFFVDFCNFLEVPFHKTLIRDFPKKPEERVEISEQAHETAYAIYNEVTREVKDLLGRVPAAWTST